MEAAGLSGLGAAFKAGGSFLGGFGQASADRAEAQQFVNEGTMARITGLQTAASMTRSLADSLGNIDAIFAAGKTSGPSNVAVRNTAEDIGLEQRQNKLMQYYNEAALDDRQASYLRGAANASLLGGVVGGLGAFLGGGTTTTAASI